MNINALEAFITVVDKQSYSLAADCLNISTSALSRRIKSLESSLSCRLLIRDSHRIAMTSNGKSFYSHALDIIHQFEIAKREINHQQSELHGELTVFSSLGMAKLLMPALKLMVQASPHLTVKWTLSEGRQDELSSVYFDVMLHIDTPQDTGYIGQYLGEVALDYYASPEYLARNGRINSKHDLENIDLIYSSASPNAPKSWELNLGGKSQIISVAPKYIVGSPDLAIELASQNLGVARLPKFMARTHVQQGILALACTETQSFRFPIYAIYPSRSFLPEKSRVFIEQTKQVLAQAN
ncbi:LysR family transcriptional regulator [Vibrio mediterranei]|uniref:LysR family transcriptional regulator n=1 Tax=Vibrio mediterranei TaxID=689 RepID=UPI002284D798|nr:LysR family transcriptional regulator [Vibrio mediterranei]MCY9855525.1 LysR family transcriptional regulator [Vibrio mediterranei]